MQDLNLEYVLVACAQNMTFRRSGCRGDRWKELLSEGLSEGSKGPWTFLLHRGHSAVMSFRLDCVFAKENAYLARLTEQQRLM